MDLDDSGRLDSRPQDILFCRLVVFGAEALQVVQEAVGFRISLGSLHTRICEADFDFDISPNRDGVQWF